MNQVYRDYLFGKHFLVRNEAEAEAHTLETLFSLANLLNIRIVSGSELVTDEMISYAARMIGQHVPQPFYRGFPDTVRELSPDKLLFDQLVHYTVTYGFGDFSEAGHSLFEREFERIAFKENAAIKEFSVITEEDAVKRIAEAVGEMLQGSRPLSEGQFAVVKSYIGEYGYKVTSCASKNTALRLLVALRDMQFVRFLSLADAVKVADEINYVFYGKTDVRDMNWKNRDRRFLAAVIDALLAGNTSGYRDCFEKKALWSGILHHLHYRAKTEEGREFVNAMRGRANNSVYSAFEREMSGGNIREALRVLKEGKGSGAVLRNLDYILSRCESEEQRREVVGEIDANNGIVLLQLLVKYTNAAKHEAGELRSFRFTRHNLLAVHNEQPEEAEHRKTYLSKETNAWLAAVICDKITEHFGGRLGKVYIDPSMKETALPIQENASFSGFGVMAKGSRLPLDLSRKVRAFTYWEKVNDIDLSMFGINREGKRIEFSWRTMAGQQSSAVMFSGDQTSGYEGGSEYFDVDIEKFRKLYPDIRYVIFCDNVYSGTNFSNCFCKAGYMIRDRKSTGKVFEPKTVQTSFLVNCESTFAYLFGIDLVDEKFVWLNLSNQGRSTVAGTNSMDFLLDCFDTTSIINMYSFFELLASEVTNDPSEAEMLVSDTLPEDGRPVIRSFDFEKIMKYMQ